MGFGSNGTKVLYGVEIDRVDVYDAGTHLLRQSTPGAATSARPIMAVDVNNIAHIVGRSSNNVVLGVYNHLVELARLGFIVIPVCDGETRPISKQASNKNNAVRVRAKNNAIINRQKVRSINRQLEDCGNEEERKKWATALKKMEGKVKTAETQSKKVVPSNLADLLQIELNKIPASNSNNISGGDVSRVRTAKFEADSLMSGLYLEGGCHLIQSTDVDYQLFLGDNYVGMNKWNGKRITLSSTSRKALEDIVSCLKPESQLNVKWKEAKLPIFEGVTDTRTRVLIAVIIGCDVCPVGVNGIGVTHVEAKLKAINEQQDTSRGMYDELMKWAVEWQLTKPKKVATPQYNEEVLNEFVDGIIYEPTNELGNDKHTYMHGEPTHISQYNSQFKTTSTTIRDGPEILQCKGACPNSSHYFLAAVTHHTCPVCNEVVCTLCSDVVEKVHHCLSCSFMQSVLPGEDEDEKDMPTVSEMRDELKNKYKFDKVDQLSVSEVEDVYLSYVLHRYLEDLAESVEFPKYPTSSIESGEHWEELADIDLSYGGSFVLSEDIDVQHIPKILELFASFVKFDDPKEKKYTNWEQDKAVYSAIPEMFIKISNKCRVDLGYRLLRRAIRHAFDTRTESLDDKTVKLILCSDGNLGIQISTPIPASMKKDVYPGTTVLTADELLACECGCMSGSKGKEKRACVHVLPRALLLSTLLAEDLAEHMLFELTSLVTLTNVDENSWSPDQIDSMKNSITTLIEASGDTELSKQMASCTTLNDMLQTYRTGTQKRKEWNRVHTPPKDKEMCPITDLNFDSPEQMCKEVFKRSSPKANLDSTEEIVTFEPDYVKVGQVLNAAGIPASQYPFVGFELFQHRRDEQPCDRDAEAMGADTARIEWKKLVQETKERSTRQSPNQSANLQLLKNNHTTPAPKSRKRKASKYSSSGPSGHSPSHTCAKCGANSDTEGLSFHRIPPYPPEIEQNASLQRRITHRGKCELHTEIKDRAGRGRHCRQPNLRICSGHEKETKSVTADIEVPQEDGSIKVYRQTYELTVMTAAGKNSSVIPSETSKGVGRNRFERNYLNPLSTAIAAPAVTPPHNETELELADRLRKEAEAELAATRLAMQQIVELHSPEAQSPEMICPSVSKAAGLVPSNVKSNLHPCQMKQFKAEKKGTLTLKKVIPSSTQNTSSTPGNPKPRKKHEYNVDKPPSILLTTPASEVKRRTGFNNMDHLLAYAIIICNGDLDRLRTRKTTLTWLEELFLHFEWKLHETNRRKKDMMATWGIGHHQINAIKDSKLALEMAALLSWPRFALYEEDFKLREQHNPGKWKRYDGQRVIQWDMTNVPAVAFSNASLQRATWSEYYGMNCFKGGVGIQYCGWIVVWDLYGGGTPDTDYHSLSGYLQHQEQFAKTDLVNINGKDTEVPFHITLDRGYRSSSASYQCGKQLTLQPEGMALAFNPAQ